MEKGKAVSNGGVENEIGPQRHGKYGQKISPSTKIIAYESERF